MDEKIIYLAIAIVFIALSGSFLFMALYAKKETDRIIKEGK